MDDKYFKDSSKKLESLIEETKQKLRKLAFDYLTENNLIVGVGSDLSHYGAKYTVVKTSVAINMNTKLPCVHYSLIKLKKSGDYAGKGKIIHLWDYELIK